MHNFLHLNVLNGIAKCLTNLTAVGGPVGAGLCLYWCQLSIYKSLMKNGELNRLQDWTLRV